jgi:hypothetical protein
MIDMAVGIIMAPRRIEWVDQVFLGGRFSA